MTKTLIQKSSLIDTLFLLDIIKNGDLYFWVRFYYYKASKEAGLIFKEEHFFYVN